MFRKFNRAVSLLLALAMVLSMVPVLVYAEDEPAEGFSYRACEHSNAYVLQSDSHEATDTVGGFRHYKCSKCGAEYSYETAPMVYTVNPKTGEPVSFDHTANPYLPNYEFMPDNELHVFWSREDNEWRVYAVGSHDTKMSGWCGPDITCWSAPVYDLSDWRFEALLRNTGLFFACDFNYDLSTDQAVLYAFPFFGNPEMKGTHLWVNGHSVPDAPFTTPLSETGIEGLDGVNKFDPAIYIAPDGTMLCTYDDSTGGAKHCQIAKVNPKDLTTVEWTADVKMAEGEYNILGFNPKEYEGSTIDRVDIDGHWFWVVQYSYKSDWSDEDYEVDIDGDHRWWPLAYVYSDPDMQIDELKDFTGWHWGGILSDNAGFLRKDAGSDEITLHPTPTYCWGNNHGGLVNINGQWFISNHRHTSDGAGRQGFIEKVTMSMKDGKLIINPVEYTSSMAESITAYNTWSARIACHLWPTVFSETHAQTLYIDTPLRNAPADYWDFIYTAPEYAEHRSPVVGIVDGAEVGFKYLNFGEKETLVDLTVLVSQAEGYVDGTMNVYIDAPATEQGGKLIGTMSINAADIAAAGVKVVSSDETAWSELTATMTEKISGIHGVYFVFESEEEGNICKLDEFTFSQTLYVETEPETFAGKIGETAVFTVEASKDDVTYQWYYSNNGWSWSTSSMEGAATDTLSVEMKAFRVGQQYKCVITDAEGNTVTSQVVELTVATSTAKIVENPADAVVSVGATAAFAVKAEGEGLTYQWMYSNNGGASWSKSTASGSNTATLSIEVKAFRNGQMYKCIVCDAQGNAVESAAASIVIEK